MQSNKPGRFNWGRQWSGALAGGLLSWGVANLFPILIQSFGLLTIILWGAAIGAVLTNLDGFSRAGAALTHHQNHLLNLVVGLGVPALVLLLISFLLSLS